MLIRTIASTTLAVAVLAACAPRTAWAKPRHLEQVRVALVAKAARCNSCHTTDDGAALNAYGQRLHEGRKGDSLADRILALEADPPPTAIGDEVAEQKAGQDVDGDGVPNWIEILAGASPAAKDDTPKDDVVGRIRRVVDCKMCHVAVDQPGQGLDANPHNHFGKLLAKTLDIPRGQARPKTKEAIRLEAERTPILRRIALAKTKKPPKSPASYWQRVRLLFEAVADTGPTVEAVKEFRKKAAAQRTKRKRDPTLGLETDAHKADGFLQDGAGLD